MGLSPEEAHCTLRFSLSHDTTEANLTYAVNALLAILQEARSSVWFDPCR
jgi:cysteine sulfinate desulfinase/cysteine desulfurase-like protein